MKISPEISTRRSLGVGGLTNNFGGTRHAGGGANKISLAVTIRRSPEPRRRAKADLSQYLCQRQNNKKSKSLIN